MKKIGAKAINFMLSKVIMPIAMRRMRKAMKKLSKGMGI